METAPGPFPVSLDIAVAWGEMDAYQHVNNTVYLRWCESARIEYFARAGLLSRKERDGVGPILARQSIDYRRPVTESAAVTYPDTVKVEVGVSRIGGSSFTMQYRITSRAQGAEVAAADSVIVLLDYGSGRSTPVDAGLRAVIEALEGRAL
jgi:acyl-CoA thioester hydrolase